MDALQLITILVMSGVRKEIIKMTGKEYVELAMRTNDGNATDRIEKAIELLHRPDELAFVMGVDQSVISKNINSGIKRIQRELRAYLEED